jgi:hypothetical protein
VFSFCDDLISALVPRYGLVRTLVGGVDSAAAVLGQSVEWYGLSKYCVSYVLTSVYK